MGYWITCGTPGLEPLASTFSQHCQWFKGTFTSSGIIQPEGKGTTSLLQKWSP